MANTAKIIDYDLGKTMKCLVTVTDNVTGENTTVASNEIGPINRPIVPEFDVWVNGELHDDPSKQVGVSPGGSVPIEVRAEPATNPAVDMTYKWAIRTGTGRLSGDDTATGIIYIAPDEHPAGGLVVCTVQSRDAADQATAAEVTILTAE